VLESVRGDKTQAAQLLGISRRTLERRVVDWGQT
jgi:DNA-binding protein Fis